MHALVKEDAATLGRIIAIGDSGDGPGGLAVENTCDVFSDGAVRLPRLIGSKAAVTAKQQDGQRREVFI